MVSIFLTWNSMNLNKRITIESEELFYSTVFNSRNTYYLSKNKSLILNSFLSDLSAMMGVFSQQLPEAINSFLLFIIVSIRLLLMNKLFFLLTLVFSIFPLFLSSYFGKLQAEYGKAKKGIQDRYIRFLEETASGIQNFNNNIRRSFFLTKFHFLLEQSFSLVRDETKLSIKSSLAFFSNNFLTSAVLYMVLGFSVLNGKNSIGELVASLMLAQKLRAIILDLGNGYQTLLINLVSTQRVFHIFNSTRITPSFYIKEIEREKNSKSIIINNLSIAFEDTVVFSGYNLTLNYPGIYIIKGRNGCGKTTLLNCIQGFVSGNNVKSGTITLENISHENMASISQTSELLSLSIYDNLTVGVKCTYDDIHEILEKTSMLNRIEELPNLLNSVIPDDVVFSKGQSQKILLGRCLLQNAEVLLFDEPETALDKETKEFLRQFLITLKTKRLVVLATHQDSFDDIATMVISL